MPGGDGRREGGGLARRSLNGRAARGAEALESDAAFCKGSWPTTGSGFSTGTAEVALNVFWRSAEGIRLTDLAEVGVLVGGFGMAVLDGVVHTATAPAR